MRIIKLFAAIFGIGLFLMACGSNETQQTAADDRTLMATPQVENDYWAKENLDLQRVGTLLERTNNPEEFETLLNSEDGINNLDLNGDGYVDYISVDEFEERDGNERGLSLFSRFGPDLIQEIATIVFYRDDIRSPGARVLLTGNDQIYGDNQYYEADWVDRSVGIVTALFGNGDRQYRSPYYYEDYPANYAVYEAVGTPIYRTRIERAYPTLVFIATPTPSVITKVKIKSHHKGKWMDKVYAKLVKPSREQLEFRQKNPNRPQFVRIDRDKRGDDSRRRDDHQKDDRGGDRDRGKSPGGDDDGKHRGRSDKEGKGKKDK